MIVADLNQFKKTLMTLPSRSRQTQEEEKKEEEQEKDEDNEQQEKNDKRTARAEQYERERRERAQQNERAERERRERAEQNERAERERRERSDRDSNEKKNASSEERLDDKLSQLFDPSLGIIELNMQNLNLGDQVVMKIMKKLETASTLRFLNMAENKLTNKSFEAFVTSIKKNKSGLALEYANFARNKISDEALKFLARNLPNERQVNRQVNRQMTLILDDNPIEDDGVRALAEALTTSSWIGELSLNNVLITDAGAQTLATAFTKSSLNYLYLQNNRFLSISMKAYLNQFDRIIYRDVKTLEVDARYLNSKIDDDNLLDSVTAFLQECVTLLDEYREKIYNIDARTFRAEAMAKLFQGPNSSARLMLGAKASIVSTRNLVIADTSFLKRLIGNLKLFKANVNGLEITKNPFMNNKLVERLATTMEEENGEIQLETINFSDCALTDACARSIVRIVQIGAPKLRSINLSGNRFSDIGASQINSTKLGINVNLSNNPI